MNLALRFAARSDVGLVRADNQDSGYAGPDLLAVADGMGGHAGGDIASTLAIRSLVPLDGHQHVPDGALTELEQAIEAAKQAIVDRSEAEPQLAGMGTTVTAILRAGNQLVMAHLGDSRAYLLRDDELTQVTTDHTFVQHLVDTGRIAPEDAEHHPQRNVVMRVLGDFEVDLTPDLSVREARPGDRWLLCSDGLSGFVTPDMIAQILISVVDPGECADTLIQLALRAGSTDNVTAIVADVVDLDADTEHPVEGAVPHPADALADEPLPTSPEVVGSASRDDLVPGTAALGTEDGTETEGAPGVNDDPEADEAAAALAAEPGKGKARRRALGATITLVLVLAILGGGYAAYGWTQNQYFVGESEGKVAVFQGVPQNIGPLHLSSPVELTDTAVDSLPSYVQDRLSDTIPATSLSDARTRAAQVATDGTTPEPTTTPTPTLTPATPATTAPPSTPTTTTPPTKPTIKTTHGPATKGEGK
ncbi:protein phosphatase 2C domain-containing protein [Luteimicrobium xylanilyticum]|uniref:Serine/threonine protein phosphatase PstP n=1 Tax=Luteimicrobium xylanilyticum TaxID=1133546 RepID=A0A5P9QGL3_9MICO|nr:PP2C family serine/threonine-protein phosphatase [Luteimicrobium xylanilyticum]QFV00223.1 Protein-serine/threonine phosphatase [Luteimicrobium xylanilyticum]